jgi:molecular chaperone HtpG
VLDYINWMPEVQKTIYYLMGEFLDAVRDSPFLEVLKKKGFEVVVVVVIDAIDKYAIMQLKEFDGKKLVCVSKEGLELEETVEEKTARKAKVTAFQNLCSVMKDALKTKSRKSSFPIVLLIPLVSLSLVSLAGHLTW